MSMFDVVEIPCPVCGEPVEFDAYPVQDPTRMERYCLSTAPDEVLKKASYCMERCGCETGLMITGSEFDGWRLQVSREYPATAVPEAIRFVEQ